MAASRVLLVLAAVLWSLGGVFIKSLPVSAMGITLYRSLFAGLVLLPFLRGRKRPGALDLLLLACIYTLMLACYVAATQRTSAANAIFLQYTAPIYVILFSPWLLKERITRPDLVTLGVAAVGIACLIGGSIEAAHRAGILLGLASGLGFALFMIALRRVRYADPLAVTCLNNLVAALLLVPLVAASAPGELQLVARAGETPEARQALLFLLLMGPVQIAAPYILFTLGLRHVRSAEASLITLVEPVLNPVWVAFGVREWPSVPTVVGGAFIVLGLALRYTVLPRLARAHVSRSSVPEKTP